ncbi:MAG TPA: response regulator, partial [Anaerolineae bacterium]|nr:response regulator [Anaerolineae bacterium]
MAQELDALIGWNLSEDIACYILESGMPIIYLSETGVRHPRCVSPRGLYDVARILGEYVVERLTGQGNVLIVGGLIEGIDDGASRLAGFTDVLRNYPEIAWTHIPSAWRYDKAYNTIYTVVQQLHRPFDALFGLSDSLALAGRDVGRELGLVHEHTLVVGVNGDPLALAAIAEGSMTATVETSAADFGSQAVELACRAARGEPLPAHFGYNPRLVTAENVAAVAMQKLIAIADLPSRLVGVSRQREQQRLTELETSLEINKRIGSILDRQQLAHEIADLIRTNYGYDEVQIFLWSKADQALVLDHPGRPEAGRIRIPLSESGVLGQVLKRNRPVFIPDARHSRRFPPDPRWPTTRSRVVLPIRLGSKMLGLLDLHSHHSTQHSHQELIGLQSLADQLGIAMHNAELYSKALEAQATAEKANQLKSRLLTNVSHELRTPLNVILGYSQAALASPNPYNVELPPALLHDLRHIYHSAEHLTRVINDLLDLSRAEVGELDIFPETIATRAFLEDVFHSMAGSAEADNSIEWRLKLPPRLPLIQADPVRLRQILLNLLSNACKFTDSGHVTLGAEVTPPYLHIWVQDTGTGIPVEMQERIFEPFVTAERPGQGRKGIGLGLSITRQLVALHHGSITLESQPGQGSTFHVYLPLPSLNAQPANLPDTAQPVLLLVSAQKEPAAEIRELSQRQGLAIRRLREGDDLTAVLSEVQPAAVAWDLADATPNDWMVIQRLRSHPHLCQLPLILYGQDQEEEMPGLIMGVTDFLVKPVRQETLLRAVGSLWQPEISGPILIVDDDPEARELYQSLLARELPDYPIRTAADGAEALTILEQEIPSLVILDLMMPNVDGFEVLERMRSRPKTRTVPVIVMSGRMLSFEDVQRLDHAQVTFCSKDILTETEATRRLRQALAEEDMLPKYTSAVVK